MDMEFGGICGTWQRMKLPVEAGVIVHDPARDGLLFYGRKFSYDMDITVWKNITDNLGRTVGKNPCSFNPAKTGVETGYVRKIRFDREGRQKAYRVSRVVHGELKEFMRSLNGRGIGTIMFFAADYEKTALSEAQVNLSGFEVRDLQRDIKAAFSLKEVLSLDRISHIIGFSAGGDHMSSHNFRYPVPPAWRTGMNPHNALGDAARIFLADQEFHLNREELEKRIREYLALCEHQKKPGTGDDSHGDPGIPENE